MTIVIKIKTDNAAFEERDAEIARIVREVARWIDSEGIDDGAEARCRDLNGNTVGSVTVRGK